MKSTNLYRRSIITTIIILVNLIGSLNNSVIQIALPELSIESNVDYASLSIIISLYWLAAGAFAFPSGKLGEVYTPRRIFLLCLGLFSISSFLCILSQHYLLIAIFRALQGISLSGATVNSIALLRKAYPENERGQALGIWSASTSLGYILGPSLGGGVSSICRMESCFWNWGHHCRNITYSIICCLAKIHCIKPEFRLFGSSVFIF